MLWERFQTGCNILVPSTADDGEGGRNTSWSLGEAFDAAIVRSSTATAREAEKEGVNEAYTVTSTRVLQFHEVFRRESDSQVFRCVSHAMETPEAATWYFAQSTAEPWELPGEVVTDGD